MTKWDKLNKEFDIALDSMTTSDWNKIKNKTKNQNQNKMKQTAVEWLVEILELSNPSKQYQAEIEQAKEMEKEQIINSFVDGADKGEMFNNENRAFTTDAEQYYKETFKSE